MEAIESEVKKLIDFGFIREEQQPDWVASIVSFTKRMKIFRFASTSEI